MTVEEHFATHNDFRSDTFTLPTVSMRNAVIRGLSENFAQGDAVYQEDPKTLELERAVAEMAGKEAGLFCVSGTMLNQVGLRAALFQPPYLILCHFQAHVFLHEAGGLAALSQAMVHPVVPANGRYLTLEDVAENWTPSDGDVHAAPTKVISLENTLHGTVMPLAEIERIAAFARENGLHLHCDGARLFNAAVETRTPLRDWCAPFDSVLLCLSKSLGAPMGSVLVGRAPFVAKANHFKKQAGGGIRQNGVVAQMALTALAENMERIAVGHSFCKEVAAVCDEHGIALECPPDTNFIFVDLKRNQMDDRLLVEMAAREGLRLMGGRLAFHFQLSRQSVEKLKRVLVECKRQAVLHPFVKSRSNKQMYNVDVVRGLPG